MGILNKLNIKSDNLGGCIAKDQWFASATESITSFNPANGEAIANVKPITAADYEKIYQHSYQAFLQWREIPAPKRGEVIRQMGNALRENKDSLGTLVAMEMGKSIQEGHGEVQEMIDIADFAVGQSRMLYGLTMHSERPQHRMYEQWHPLGVIGVISAFNFPVAVWAWNAFIAAICGNSVLWKPSSKTPLTAIAVQHICNDVLARNQMPAIFSLMISDSNATAECMVKDKRVPLVSFTGSTRAGRHVAQLVSERLGKTILELGGNNAIIIDETADLELAIPAVVFGAVGTAGQRCTSTRRVIVHESIVDKFSEKLIHAYKQVTIGDPLDTKNLMGPLVDQPAVDSYLNAVAAIKTQGGEILFGGNALDRAGYFVEPCIARVTQQTEIVQHETFAPILYVMSYKTLDEALELHNAVAQGLSSAIFTNHVRHAEQFLSACGSDCGIANVNIGTSGAEIGGAFGGEKDTGGGRESGSDSWKAYMRRQTNTINWSRELPLAQGIEFDLK
ncbi:MAG: aldehyde dehydrogenase family protein [Pseudomonadota bacterium]